MKVQTEMSIRARSMLTASVVNVGLILLVAGGTLLVEKAGWFESIDDRLADIFRALQATPAKSDILIIDIDDISFNDPALFNGKSPLSTSGLRALMNAVIAGKPAAIGVDVYTRLTCSKIYSVISIAF